MVLIDSPVTYPYFEAITKTVVASTGLHIWKQGDSFSREPVRRLAFCLNTNEAFFGNNRLSPFNYRKLGLKQLYIHPNGLPVADSRI